MTRLSSPAAVAAAVIAAAITAASCRVEPGGSTAVLTLSLAPAAPRSASSTRLLPDEYDGVYLQLADGTAVRYSASVRASPGEAVTITESVPAGSFDLHVFAVYGSRITGVAVEPGLLLVADSTTELSLTMSPLDYLAPTVVAGIGPGDAEAEAVERVVGGFPPAFDGYLLSGTAEVRVKRDSPPADADDASLRYDATIGLDGGTLTLTASVPAGEAAGNETLYYWFSLEWPDCGASIVDVGVDSANRLVYDGATLSGAVAANPGSGYRAEADATVDLGVSGSVLYQATTDAFGAYRFGSVDASTYGVRVIPTDTATWTTYIYSGESDLNAAGYSTAGTTVLGYDAAYPCGYAVVYSSLTLAPGSVTTLDFRFQGY